MISFPEVNHKRTDLTVDDYETFADDFIYNHFFEKCRVVRFKGFKELSKYLEKSENFRGKREQILYIIENVCDGDQKCSLTGTMALARDGKIVELDSFEFNFSFYFINIESRLIQVDKEQTKVTWRGFVRSRLASDKNIYAQNCNALDYQNQYYDFVKFGEKVTEKFQQNQNELNRLFKESEQGNRPVSKKINGKKKDDFEK